MRKLVLTAVAACVSMAVSAAYAETPKQNVQVAQAATKDSTMNKGAATKEPKSVQDNNPSPGPTSDKARTPSGKQRKAGPSAKGVDDNTPSPGPTANASRKASGKDRKAGPEAKSVEENRPSPGPSGATAPTGGNKK